MVRVNCLVCDLRNDYSFVAQSNFEQLWLLFDWSDASFRVVILPTFRCYYWASFHASDHASLSTGRAPSSVVSSLRLPAPVERADLWVRTKGAQSNAGAKVTARCLEWRSFTPLVSLNRFQPIEPRSRWSADLTVWFSRNFNPESQKLMPCSSPAHDSVKLIRKIENLALYEFTCKRIDQSSAFMGIIAALAKITGGLDSWVDSSRGMNDVIDFSPHQRLRSLAPQSKLVYCIPKSTKTKVHDSEFLG